MSDVVVKRKVWDDLIARCYGLDKAHVKVGILASKGAADKHPEGQLSLVQIAAIHEFGNEHVPERAPIRTTFYVRRKQELIDMQTKLARAIVTKGMDGIRALGMLGSWGAAAVKATITEGDGLPPPNAPSTIAAKGSSRPLVDTGLLKNSITYQVVEGE